MFSRLFLRSKLPEPNFGPWLFIALIWFFGAFMQVRPTFGIVGMGTVLIIASVLVLLNRQRIWENYKLAYKKDKSRHGFWHEPKRAYYIVNVYFLWPLVCLSGVGLLYIAYIFT